MNALQDATSEATTTSTFDTDLVNAIRQGKLVQVRYCDLTEDEKRAAYVAFFHQSNW